MSILDKLSHGNSSILVFDCEFWHTLYTNEKNVSPIKKKPYYFLPREIGGFLLTKQKTWKFSKPLYVTLDPVSKKNVSLPLGKFSTVTANTAEKLSLIEHKFKNSLGELFANDLNSEEEKLWNEGYSIYKNDPNIKNSHKPHSWLNSFMKLYSTSTIVVKGTHDITAIKNLCVLKGIEYKEPLKTVDIVMWNERSHDECGTAKLEETYLCIKDDFSSEIKEIEKKLKIGNAHDPVTDSAMTLLVSLYMIDSS